MANRTILGEFDGTYVLRVSRPGADVLNASLSPEFLAFDSRWQDTARVYMSGVVSPWSAIGNDAYIDIPLGYAPTNTTLPVILMQVRCTGTSFYHEDDYVGVMPFVLLGSVARATSFFISKANYHSLHYKILRPFG